MSKILLVPRLSTMLKAKKESDRARKRSGSPDQKLPRLRPPPWVTRGDSCQSLSSARVESTDGRPWRIGINRCNTSGIWWSEVGSIARGKLPAPQAVTRIAAQAIVTKIKLE
mmetsp:Transcript_18418/g.34103  ORF Transcript_18418/g.34103 Transcript_18418/m.34103 type:complete len:112 (-) Transcript_18418:606-941(-)